jgi:hypothetical protein
LQYLFITLAALHGGHYEVGFWMTIATAVVTGVLCLGQLLINGQQVWSRAAIDAKPSDSAA